MPPQLASGLERLPRPGTRAVSRAARQCPAAWPQQRAALASRAPPPRRSGASEAPGRPANEGLDPAGALGRGGARWASLRPAVRSIVQDLCNHL
jgi:hypothetical protein